MLGLIKFVDCCSDMLELQNCPFSPNNLKTIIILSGSFHFYCPQPMKLNNCPPPMKLNNCRSQKFIPSPKQQPSPQDSLADDSPQICQLLQKLHNLQQRQQKTNNFYLSKIAQLKNVLAQQNTTTASLEEHLRELKKENYKQLAYLEDIKREIIKELNHGPLDVQIKKSIQVAAKNSTQREKSSGKGGLRLRKSMNLRDTQNRSSSKSNSRSKLTLFKASSTLFRKNSQTLLKKSGSTRDLIKIQSEYFEQTVNKY